LRHRTRSDYCRSDGYGCLSTSRSVCQWLASSSLDLSLASRPLAERWSLPNALGIDDGIPGPRVDGQVIARRDGGPNGYLGRSTLVANFFDRRQGDHGTTVTLCEKNIAHTQRARQKRSERASNHSLSGDVQADWFLMLRPHRTGRSVAATSLCERSRSPAGACGWYFALALRDRATGQNGQQAAQLVALYQIETASGSLCPLSRPAPRPAP
jgi:hypothetical protein